MKFFFTGLLVFFIYATVCVAVLVLVTPDLATDRVAGSDEDFRNRGLKESVESNDSILLENEVVLDEKQDSLGISSIPIDSISSIEQSDPPINAMDPEPKVENTSFTAPSKFNIKLPNGRLLINCNEFARVYKDADRVKIPFACKDYGLVIKSFLEENPSTTLLITGYSDPSESLSTGKNRAEYLKRLLSTAGIAKDRIVTAVAVSGLDIEKGYADGGIQMDVKGTVSNPTPGIVQIPQPGAQVAEDLDQPRAETTLSSKKITSGFQGPSFYGDQKFTAYTTEIKKLLNQNPGSKVYAYSYASADGGLQDPFVVTRENAATVRKLLIQAGIPANKIQSIARGEQPSGTTGSNRCILITVK